MNARVIRPFLHRNTGIVWDEGETFAGSEVAVRELAERGYLEPPDGVGGADLSTLNAQQLRAMCAERGLDAPKRATRAQLRALLGE